MDKYLKLQSEVSDLWHERKSLNWENSKNKKAIARIFEKLQKKLDLIKTTIAEVEKQNEQDKSFYL